MEEDILYRGHWLDLQVATLVGEVSRAIRLVPSSATNSSARYETVGTSLVPSLPIGYKWTRAYRGIREESQGIPLFGRSVDMVKI